MDPVSGSSTKYWIGTKHTYTHIYENLSVLDKCESEFNALQPSADQTYSLSSEFICSHRNTVDKLHGTPEPVEFNTFVNMHDTIGWGRATPDGVLEVAPNACQNNFKHG